MPRSRFLLVAVLILTALVGCASAEEGQICLLIGVRTGISIGIAVPVAERVDAAQMTVCWDGSCRTRSVILYPSSRTVDDGCTGSGPDAVCSAHLVATGEKNGFADIAGLPSSPVEVTVILTDPAGTRIVDQTLMLTPKIVDADELRCHSAPQGRITVGPDAKARPAD